MCVFVCVCVCVWCAWVFVVGFISLPLISFCGCVFSLLLINARSSFCFPSFFLSLSKVNCPFSHRHVYTHMHTLSPSLPFSLSLSLSHTHTHTHTHTHPYSKHQCFCVVTPQHVPVSTLLGESYCSEHNYHHHFICCD